MISHPNQIFYACIAKGTAILADFTSKSNQSGIEAFALQCIEKTPPFHAMFSHTVGKRSYTFLSDSVDPFVYFAIYDKDLDKIDAYEFLNRLKSSFEEVNRGGSNKEFSSHCFQSQFNPIFREILELEIEFSNQTTSGDSRKSRNLSLDSTKGQAPVGASLLGGKPSKILKKKNRFFGDGKDVVATENNKVGVGVDGHGNAVDCRDFSPPPAHRSGTHMADARKKAKQVWRKHVWVVLILDLVVCAIMFGIWLSVCRGFNCIDG